LYNILIEFGIPKQVVRAIKVCLNETYSKVYIGKYLSDSFPIQNGLKQEDALSPLPFNFVLEYGIREKTPWPLVREGTIPTERRPLVDEI
jgi:hypothetical protein